MGVERLVGVQVIDDDQGRPIAVYRLINGKAEAVLGGDRLMCLLPEQGIWLPGAYGIIAREMGKAFGIDMGREGPYLPEDGARYILAFMAERTTHRGNRTEPIVQAAKLPTSVDLLSATPDGDVFVERFMLDPNDPTRAIQEPGSEGTYHASCLIREGISLSPRSVERLIVLAASHGLPNPPYDRRIPASDGPLFLLALIAQYDGHVLAVPSDDPLAQNARHPRTGTADAPPVE